MAAANFTICTHVKRPSLAASLWRLTAEHDGEQIVLWATLSDTQRVIAGQPDPPSADYIVERLQVKLLLSNYEPVADQLKALAAEYGPEQPIKLFAEPG